MTNNTVPNVDYSGGYNLGVDLAQPSKLTLSTEKHSSPLFSYPHLLLTAAALTLIYYFCGSFGPLFFTAPYVDDVDAILNFLNESERAASWKDVFRLILNQHNEHRIAVSRLIATLMVAFTGSFSFVTASWIGLSALIATPLLLIWSFQGTPALPRWAKASACLFPFCCFAFQPAGYEGLMWTTVSMATTFCTFFATLSAILVFQKGVLSLLLSVFFALLAVYSQGNGIVVLVAIPPVLLLRKEWLRAALFLCAAGLIGALYFSDFVPNPHHPKLSDSLPHVARNLEYLGYFMGVLFASGSRTAALWYGGATAALIAVLVGSGYQKRNPAILTMIAFVVGSMAVNALSRSEMGVDYVMTQRRYLFIASLLPAFVTTALLDRFYNSARTLPLAMLIWCSCSFFTYVSYQTYLPQAEALSAQVREGLRGWAIVGRGLIYPWGDRADTVVGDSIRLGVYNPGERNKARALERLRNSQQPTS